MNTELSDLVVANSKQNVVMTVVLKTPAGRDNIEHFSNPHHQSHHRTDHASFVITADAPHVSFLRDRRLL